MADPGGMSSIFLPYFSSIKEIYTTRFEAFYNSTDLPNSIQVKFINIISSEISVDIPSITATFDSKVQYSVGDIVLLNLKVDVSNNTGVFYMASGAATGSGAVPDPENPDNSTLTIGRAKLTWNESTESLDVEIIPKTTDEGGSS